MKLFEFEGKEILKEIGIKIPRGGLASSPKEAKAIAIELQSSVAIKAQLMQGSRGKAGGILFADDPKEAEVKAESLLKRTIQGEEVNVLLVEECLKISKEYYLAVTFDAEAGLPLVLSSDEGGVHIEEVLSHSQNRVNKTFIKRHDGLYPYEARTFTYSKMGLKDPLAKSYIDVLMKLCAAFIKYDGELFEINPLILTEEGDLIAADAKVIMDDNALYRQKVKIIRDRYPNDLEYKAAKSGFNYVKLEGNIGVLCTGAGLTMTTIDLIDYYGGKAANFLEFGGATYGQVKTALGLLLEDTDVKILVINSFGLVARVNIISEGLVAAIHDLKPTIPIFVSMRGTGEDEARRILRENCTEVQLFPTAEQAIIAAVNWGSGS